MVEMFRGRYIMASADQLQSDDRNIDQSIGGIFGLLP